MEIPLFLLIFASQCGGAGAGRGGCAALTAAAERVLDLAALHPADPRARRQLGFFCELHR